MIFTICCLLLLTLAEYLFFTKRQDWSILIFFLFVTDGFQIIPYPGGALNFQNFASAYAILTVVLILFSKGRLPKNKLTDTVKPFFLYIIIVILWSTFYYDYSFVNTLKVLRRDYILFLVVFIFPYLKSYQIDKVIRILFYITIFQSILYIIQIPYGIPILNYHKEVEVGESIEGSTGLARFYNIPYYLSFYILYAISNIKTRVAHKYLFIFILFTACLATQGRTYIMSVILGILIISFINKMKVSRLVISISVIFLLTIPFSSLLESRFQEGETSSDFKSIFNKRKIDPTGGTLSFRLAMTGERLDYLIKRPLTEQLLGLGFVDDRDPEVEKRYNFKIGNKLFNGKTAQLQTPDIAFMNILVNLGLLGVILFVYFYIKFFRLCYHRRREPYMLIAVILLIINGINLLASSYAGTASAFIIVFFVYNSIKSINFKSYE